MNKSFRIALQRPVDLNADGSIVANTDYDWRDHTYTITDYDKSIDTSLQYQVFVESIILNHITNTTGDGNAIRLPYRIETPDLFAPNYFHCSDERSTNLVLLTGYNSNYNRNVTVNDVGIPVNIDFLNRGKIRILLKDIAGKEFSGETDPDTHATYDGFADKTYYKLVLLFTPIPESLA